MHIPGRHPAQDSFSLAGLTGFLFDHVIDPVQPEKANEDQIQRHCEAHDPRRYYEEHSRGQGSDRQKWICSIEVHLEFIPDSNASPTGWRAHGAIAEIDGPSGARAARTHQQASQSHGELLRRVAQLRRRTSPPEME